MIYKDCPSVEIFKYKKLDLLPLYDEVEEIQSNFDKGTSMNDYLAGHLRHEYKIEKSFAHIEKLVLPNASLYAQKVLNVSEPIFLKELWVNYQQQYEFNPVHKHDGLISFVIWLKVPFFVEDEYKVFPLKNVEENRTSNFTFLLVNDGEIANAPLRVDKTWEGMSAMFPANMFHCVYPFYTTSEYRISVAGNFDIKK